jgi:hypothetical protein
VNWQPLSVLKISGTHTVTVGGFSKAFRHRLVLIGHLGFDLVIHAGPTRLDRPARHTDISSVLRKPDPSLKPTERGEACQIVGHTLFRPEPFFTKAEKGLCYVLDIHETHVESHATEFLEHFTPAHPNHEPHSPTFCQN